MRHFPVILFLIGFAAFPLFDNNIHGLWIPLSPDQLIEESDTIIVGTVIESTPVDVEYQSPIAANGTIKDIIGPEILTLEKYTIKVEEYLKNPQDSETVEVLSATVSGKPGGPARISGFEIGERVLFYLPKGENQTHFPMQYLPESFPIPESCDAKSVLEQPRTYLGSSFIVTQEGVQKRDNFTANKPIKFVYERDMRTLAGSSFEVHVGISKLTPANNFETVFDKVISTGSNLCEWVAIAEWEFTPEEGRYNRGIALKADGKISSTTYGSFSVITDSTKTPPPLKQFQAGVPVEEIQCGENLILLTRSNGKPPACVTPETKIILIERGWAKSNLLTDTQNLEPPNPIFITRFSTIPGSFGIPLSIAINGDQNILVEALRGSLVLNKTGHLLQSYLFENPSPHQGKPVYDTHGNYYVANPSSEDARITKHSPEGDILLAFGKTGSGDGEFLGMIDTALDSKGNIYATDYYNDRVQVFDPRGNHLLTFGGYGFQMGHTMNPTVIAIDEYDYIYVGSRYALQKFEPIKLE